MLKNIRNLFPYFLLIAIYFLFVNLEARKEMNNNIGSENEKILSDIKESSDEKSLRIKIPVFPYNE